ncbi:MAG: hypothetical protein VKP57_05845 [Candidatus Sericytochromatia bacterium]|nr:hypothetical protein [Candidatus Sericytochromatia bacterium]
MRTARILSTALVASLLLAGCQRLAIDSKEVPANKVYFTTLKGAKVLGTIEETQTATWLFWGLVPAAQPDAAQALNAYLKGNQRIQNLEIRTEQSVVDGVISTLTLGLYTQRSVIYSGEVVQ